MNKMVLNRLFILLITLCFENIVKAIDGVRQDPLLVCTLMIKNEAQVIEGTLKPLVDGGIDSFLIFDTGSTDNTIDIVRNFFEANSVKNYVIEQEEFVDFSTSRNRALDLVDVHFPQAIFILMLDAEWMLRNVQDLIKFCEQHKDNSYAAYLIRIVQNGGFEFYVDRLIRRSLHARFKFPVHEYLEFSSRGTLPHEIYIEYNPTSYGYEKTRKRFERDLKILLNAYAQTPQEPRTVFYLAQTYESLGDYENAIRFYQLRIQLNGYVEENFIAAYRLARIIEKVAKDDVDKKTIYDWALAEWYYLKAYSTRGSRIEPLIQIAQHYLALGQHAVAYLFASRASKIPFPKQDILFVEKEMYSYTRYDILGQSAWYIGEYDVGEWAIKKALEEHCDKPQLHSNLSIYLERKYQLFESKVQVLDLDSNEMSGCPLTKGRSKKWSILICTLQERKQGFECLVNKLKRQISMCQLQDCIEILYFLDNREFPVGFKRNKLIEESSGVYVNFIDDDDDVHENYISMIYEKFKSKPDCVSLAGIMTMDGNFSHRFIHSLKYDHYFEQEGVYYRSPNHLNPMKREVVKKHKFPLISWHEDFLWALEVTQSQDLKTEEELQEPYYFYKCSSKK